MWKEVVLGSMRLSVHVAIFVETGNQGHLVGLGGIGSKELGPLSLREVE